MTNIVEHIERYPNNQIKVRCYIVNGKKEGNGFVYHENGIIMGSANYINDKLEGRGLIFNENGVIIIEMNYENNELNGEIIMYHDNGDVYSKQIYINGKPIEYDENGELETTS